MIEDFFTRAVLAGLAVAVIAGPLGCVIIWRRMAFFGDALSHSALMGVAFGLALAISPMIGVTLTAVTAAILLTAAERSRWLTADATLGLVAHGGLAIGMVTMSMIEGARIDLHGLLFGDILSVSNGDLIVIWAGAAGILGLIAVLWPAILATTTHSDLARAEGIATDRVTLLYSLMLAVVVALSMRLVGVLLITALLLIPAATARRIATTPEAMAIWASVLGAAAVAVGLYASLRLDTPSGPSIVVASLAGFLTVTGATLLRGRG